MIFVHSPSKFRLLSMFSGYIYIYPLYLLNGRRPALSLFQRILMQTISLTGHVTIMAAIRSGILIGATASAAVTHVG